MNVFCNLKIKDSLFEELSHKSKEKLKNFLKFQFKDALSKVGIDGTKLEDMLSQIADNIEDTKHIVLKFIDDKHLALEFQFKVYEFLEKEELHKKYNRYVVKLWNRDDSAVLRAPFLREKGFESYVNDIVAREKGKDIELLFKFETLPDEIKEVVDAEFLEFIKKSINLEKLWNDADLEQRFNFIANILSGFSPEKRIVIAMYLSRFRWEELTGKVFTVLSELGRVTLANLDLTRESDWYKLLDDNKLEWNVLKDKKTYLQSIEAFNKLREKEELFEILKSIFEEQGIKELSLLIDKNKKRWINMIFFDILEEVPIRLRVEFTKMILKGVKFKHNLAAIKTTSEKDTEAMEKKAKTRWKRLNEKDRMTILMKLEKKKQISIEDKDSLVKEEDLDKILMKVPEIVYDDIVNTKTESEIDISSKSAASSMWDYLDETERLMVLTAIERELKITIKDKERLIKAGIEEVEKELGIGYLKLYSFAQRFRKSIWVREFEKLVKEFNLGDKESIKLVDVFNILEKKWPDRFNTMVYLVRLLLLSGVSIYYITDRILEDLHKQTKSRFGTVKAFIDVISKHNIDVNLVKDMGIKQFVDYVYRQTLDIKDKVLGFIPDEFRKDKDFLKNLYKLRSLVDDDKIIEVLEREILKDKLDDVLRAIKEYDIRKLMDYFCPEELFQFDVPCNRAKALYEKIRNIKWGEIRLIYDEDALLVISDLVSRGLTDDEIYQWLQLYNDISELIEQYKAIIGDKVFTVLKEFGLYPLEDVAVSKIIDLWTTFKEYDKFIKKFEARLKSKIIKGTEIKEETEITKWYEEGFTIDEINFWTKTMPFTLKDLEEVKRWQMELEKRNIKFDVAKRNLPIWVQFFGRDLDKVFEYIDKYGIRNVTKAFIEEVIPEFRQQIDEILKNRATSEKQFRDLISMLQELKNMKFWDDLIAGGKAEDDWRNFVSIFDDYMSRVYHNVGFSIVRYIKTKEGIPVPYKAKKPPSELSNEIEENLKELNERIDGFNKFFDEVIHTYYDLVNEIKKLLIEGDIAKVEENKQSLVSIGEEISNTFYALYNSIIRRGSHMVYLKLELEKALEI